MTLNVGRVEDGGAGGLGTEAASGLVTEVNEVLTPDLHWCVTILGSITRVERIDVRWLIVCEEGLVDSVSEVARDRHLEMHLLGCMNRRCIVTLQAAERLLKSKSKFISITVLFD